MKIKYRKKQRRVEKMRVKGKGVREGQDREEEKR